MLTVTCNMYLTIITASGVLIGIILIFRSQPKMAALVAWIVGTFFVSSEKEKNINSKTTKLKNNSSSNSNKPSKSGKEISKTVKERKAAVSPTASVSVKINESSVNNLITRKSNVNATKLNSNIDQGSRRSPKLNQNVVKSEDDFNKSNSNSPKSTREILTQTASVEETESNYISNNSERKDKKFKRKKSNRNRNRSSSNSPEAVPTQSASVENSALSLNSTYTAAKEQDSNKSSQETLVQAASVEKTESILNANVKSHLLKRNSPPADLKLKKNKVENKSSLVPNDSKVDAEKQKIDAVKLTVLQKVENHTEPKAKSESSTIKVGLPKPSIIEHYKPKKNFVGAVETSQVESINKKVESFSTSNSTTKTSPVSLKSEGVQLVESSSKKKNFGLVETLQVESINKKVEISSASSTRKTSPVALKSEEVPPIESFFKKNNFNSVETSQVKSINRKVESFSASSTRKTSPVALKSEEVQPIIESFSKKNNFGSVETSQVKLINRKVESFSASSTRKTSPVALKSEEVQPIESFSKKNNFGSVETSQVKSINKKVESSSTSSTSKISLVAQKSEKSQPVESNTNLTSTLQASKNSQIHLIDVKPKEFDSIQTSSEASPLTNWSRGSSSSDFVNDLGTISEDSLVVKAKKLKPVIKFLNSVAHKSLPVEPIDLKSKEVQHTTSSSNSSLVDIANSVPIKPIEVNSKKHNSENLEVDTTTKTVLKDSLPLVGKIIDTGAQTFIKETEVVQPVVLPPQKGAFAETISNSTLQLEEKAELPLKQIESKVMKMSTQIRVLTLNDHEHQDSTLYRIEKNWKIQFRLGPSLLGRKVSLYCNYPQKDGKIFDFDRNRYFLLPWSQDEGCQHSDDTALFTEIPIKIAGSFHYYFLYENATEPGPHGSGFFLVDPELKYGKGEILPLNGIQCQTVLSKCLGPLSTWEKKLLVGKESGYNMIHFTPIQELGESNSAYSLSAQLKLNPKFDDGKKKTSFADIEKFTSKMRSEWKVLSICDIVLNHTANETGWLQEHPDGTYNCFDCPYMRPAYLLDAALNKFSYDVKGGMYENQGIPAEISNEEHLNAIRHALYTKVFPEINLPEMYICNVQSLVAEFLDKARKEPPNTETTNQSLQLIRDSLFRRLATTVDMKLALKIYNVYRPDSYDEDSRLRNCGEQFKNKLDELNNAVINDINLHLNAAVDNTIAGIRYFRVQHDGPNVREITKKNPLCFRYFTDFGNPKTIKEYEEILYGPNSKHLMAHNGWVMNADPMQNFADADSNIYIRRELIAWGDSVKLRFGNKPEDSPFLWNHMKNYVEQTARIFDGVRLDNCHSTPIVVAEYLLDCARKVRPDLYVVAELFTNSDHTDNIFVNRLGITSLIREAMSAWDSHEEGRLVHRFGGDPVGAFYQPHIRPLVPSIAHALFLDLTHDNPSPVEKRSVFDMLPSTALVNMACCASGSNRGYDELVNHHIHVVDETREYTEWNDELSSDNRFVSLQSGIIAAKKALNDLHFSLASEGFNQVYVDQMDSDIVAVTRHCPLTHKSVILVAFTAFTHPSENANNYQRGIKPLRIEGVLDEIILEATLSHSSNEKIGSKYSHPQEFLRSSKWINGLWEYKVQMKQNIQIGDSDVLLSVNSGSPNITQLNFKNFKPGSVVAIKVSLPQTVQTSIKELRELMTSFSKREKTDLSEIIGKLNLADLNRALYRCDQEERDDGHGFDVYNIPNFGSLVYCGLQGLMSPLSTIRPNNDLGHPICGNLRDGNWLIEYIYKRLQVDEGTRNLGIWIENKTQPLKDIPRYLIPSYFDVIVTGLYMSLLDQTYNLMSDFVKNGSTFVKGLSLGSLQFGAVIKSADLPTLSPKLVDPKPPTRSEHGKTKQACVTLSAGLPHFAVGYMRNWGRDTFIALRGLFILTGRFQDARYHILGYAACLRHGLIPNLLDGGRNSRFNCRDAVWWWLYCIKCYVEEAPNGIAILSDEVSRIFPTDDSPAVEAGLVDQPLFEVIQEALAVHFQGLSFRERNAGHGIDSQMVDAGFNNQIGIHPETGFVFGGNEHNCGTWMDKMGSSDRAGNRGKPATPRDGSAVELIGLSKAVITWLNKLNQQKQYPYDGVERKAKNGSIIKWSFEQWADKIQTSFEKQFWINAQPTEGEVRPDLINKRGIYKDCLNASQNWTDFQLRCNFPIAMVVAPELFNPKHAWIALQNAEKHLLGPLGMKTLDASDWNYCGDYNNSDSSDNLKTANGFNYHQGPEWVWPVGYYLRATLHFAAEVGELAKTIAKIKIILSKHFTELQTSVWRGLPELTNSNGSFCYDSSRTQAWSMSCILEVLQDLQTIESKQKGNKLN